VWFHKIHDNWSDNNNNNNKPNQRQTTVVIPTSTMTNTHSKPLPPSVEDDGIASASGSDSFEPSIFTQPEHRPKSVTKTKPPIPSFSEGSLVHESGRSEGSHAFSLATQSFANNNQANNSSNNADNNNNDNRLNDNNGGDVNESESTTGIPMVVLVRSVNDNSD